jgi:hypothetical protein
MKSFNNFFLKQLSTFTILKIAPELKTKPFKAAYGKYLNIC